MIIFYLICFWIISGLISMGFNFAFFQRNWPSLRNKEFYKDQKMAIYDLAFGPIALIGMLIFKAYDGVYLRSHGWLWPYGKKAKLEAGIEL